MVEVFEGHVGYIQKHQGHSGKRVNSATRAESFADIGLPDDGLCNRNNCFLWRGGRVVECARLEIGCAARYRGFESRPLRHAIRRDFLRLSKKRLFYQQHPGMKYLLNRPL